LRRRPLSRQALSQLLWHNPAPTLRVSTGSTPRRFASDCAGRLSTSSGPSCARCLTVATADAARQGTKLCRSRRRRPRGSCLPSRVRRGSSRLAVDRSRAWGARARWGDRGVEAQQSYRLGSGRPRLVCRCTTHAPTLRCCARFCRPRYSYVAGVDADDLTALMRELFPGAAVLPAWTVSGALLAASSTSRPMAPPTKADDAATSGRTTTCQRVLRADARRDDDVLLRSVRTPRSTCAMPKCQDRQALREARPAAR